MRLINTETFKLEEFDDDRAPRYAILSHTWGLDSEELTFSDVQTGNIDKPGVGSLKFRECCGQAQKDSLDYAWIDTCCIDKTNLVELGEAINSMFRWYRLATVCYVYLSDVHNGDDPSDFETQFRESRWFERGWTLQELLAPKHLRFYDSHWRHIGTKGSRCTIIQEITQVPRQFLLGVAELYTASVAQRMSWASRRRTKRAEDVAYCLLGIFGITMPMIYGEGGKEAFFRLQEQIMKTTRDDSILAWGLGRSLKFDNADEDTFIYGDILAAHPCDFIFSEDIITREQATNPLHSLDIFGGSLRVYLQMHVTDTGETFGLLSCGPKSDLQQVVAIPLVKINSAAANEYVRPNEVFSVFLPAPASDALPELIHIKKDGQKNISTKNQKHMFYEEASFTKIGLNIIDVLPQDCWDTQLALISQLNYSKDLVTPQILIRFRQIDEQFLDFVVIVDFGPSITPADLLYCVVSCHRKTRLEEIAVRFSRMTLEALKQTSASNGSLHLNMKLEPTEGNIISIIPEAMTRPPDYTISATVALEVPYFEKSIRLLLKKKYADAEVERLRQKIESAKESLERVEEDQEVVESEMRQLETRKEALTTQKEIRIKDIQRLKKLQVEIRNSQKEMPTQMTSAQKQLKKFYHTKDCRDGWTPFRSAVAIGDVSMMDLLFDVTTDIMFEDKPWERWIAASITGDAEEIRSLLTNDETELEHRDGIFRRTPLHWASMHGHLEVVKQLLDTNRVDIRSEDNHGRTPLRWAMDGGHDEIARLLIRRGEPAYLRGLRGHSNYVRTVAFSHDSKLVLSGSEDRTVKLWDATTSRCLQSFEGHTGSILSVAISHDSKLVLSGSDDYTMKLWDGTTGERLHAFEGYSGPVYLVAFLDNSKLLVSVSFDRTIMLWDSATGECLDTFQSRNYEIFSIAFLHDSKLVTLGSDNENTELWDIKAGERLQVFQGHTRAVTSAAFSHDLRLVASGSYDETIKLWDSKTGKCLRTFLGHSDTIDSVSFSHDSRLIVSGESFNTINLWASSTGERLYKLKNDLIHELRVVAFSNDSKFIAAGKMDDVLLWDTSVAQELVSSSWYQEEFAAKAKESSPY
jgi:WD40 repeat protein